MLVITEECREKYPGVCVGILVMKNVNNIEGHDLLDANKLDLEKRLVDKFKTFTRSELKNLDVMKVYIDYYKRFKKNYHVLLQLESVVFKNKPIPSVSTLVEAMFMAELKNFLLTASHDFSCIKTPLRLDVSKGDEEFLTIGNTIKVVNSNDLFVADQEGIISNIVYGPDKRTKVESHTKEVMHIVYGLPGIAEEVVYDHLNDIKDYTTLFSPEASVELMEIIK